MRIKCLLLAFLVPASAFSQIVPIYPPCGTTTVTPVNNVHVSFLDGEEDDTHRREFAQISDELAAELGITGVALDPEAPNPQIRVRIQNVTGIGGSSIQYNNAVFTVVGINDTDDDRIWVYQQEDPGDDDDSGQFKLFAKYNETIVPTPDLNGDTVLDNVLVRVYRLPVSRSEYTDAGNDLTTTVHYCEQNTSKSYLERTIRANNDEIVVMTPHGRHIETDTSDQSEDFATYYQGVTGTEVNVWDLQGAWGDDQTDERWHITSTSIHQDSYPGLDALLDDAGSFDYAVSFHGYSGSNAVDCGAAEDQLVYEVILGGDAVLNLKCAISDAIVAAVPPASYPGGIAIDIRYENDGNIQIPDACGRTVSTDEHSGMQAHNIVNRVSTVGGIQVEQSKTLRNDDTLRALVTQAVAQGIIGYDSGTNYCPGS